MFKTFINKSNTYNGRRLRALGILLFVPFAVLFSIIVGTAEYLWDFVKDIARDLYELCGFVAETIGDLIFTIRTGVRYS